MSPVSGALAVVIWTSKNLPESHWSTINCKLINQPASKVMSSAAEPGSIRRLNREAHT